MMTKYEVFRREEMGSVYIKSELENIINHYITDSRIIKKN